MIETVEKEIIQRALKECGGNQVKASALLGITRATLRKRIDVFESRYYTIAFARVYLAFYQELLHSK